MVSGIPQRSFDFSDRSDISNPQRRVPRPLLVKIFDGNATICVLSFSTRNVKLKYIINQLVWALQAERLTRSMEVLKGKVHTSIDMVSGPERAYIRQLVRPALDAVEAAFARCGGADSSAQTQHITCCMENRYSSVGCVAQQVSLWLEQLQTHFKPLTGCMFLDYEDSTQPCRP